jgi:hypothetical protein
VAAVLWPAAVRRDDGGTMGHAAGGGRGHGAAARLLSTPAYVGSAVERKGAAGKAARSNPYVQTLIDDLLAIAAVGYVVTERWLHLVPAPG